MARELGDPDRAAALLEEVAATLRPLADRPDLTVLVGLVETLGQLAQLRAADACRLHREALERWRARGGGTAYLRHREEEILTAAARCAAKL
jgi:hypothetical protein